MGDYEHISLKAKCVVRRNSKNNFNSIGKPENILSDILGRRATNFDRPLKVYVGHVRRSDGVLGSLIQYVSVESVIQYEPV